MKKLCVLFLLVFYCVCAMAQKQKFDSLAQAYASERTDSVKVKLLWQMADASNIYKPDTSLILAEQALYLAKKINYTEGVSRSLGVMAVACMQIGNYKKALELLLQKLQIEENRNNPYNLASTLINIGTQYTSMEQYNEALNYYKRAESIVNKTGIPSLSYYINNNLGDVYERMNIDDSAFIYFGTALAIATKENDADLMGSTMVGFGHIYLKQKKYDLARQYYRDGLSYLEQENDDDLACEASMGLAKLYMEQNVPDSAKKYALYAYDIAHKDGFESRELDAATFLSGYFKNAGNIEQAFAYNEIMQQLKDSINSKENIRALQIISSDEQMRQNEIAESKRKAEEEREQQLQMLLIGIFIAFFFIITALLSRVKVHHRLIRFLGVLSLLMLFEYLLLLLHPWVVEFTHHTPVYEIIIFVAIASILVPAHHRIEHWVIEYLVRKRTRLPKPSEEEKTDESTVQPAS